MADQDKKDLAREREDAQREEQNRVTEQQNEKRRSELENQVRNNISDWRGEQNIEPPDKWR